MVDPVWEHGQKYKDGFVCKYCREQKNGGGATWFKEHLAHRGSNVRDCPSVPPDVKKFFIEQLDRNKAKAAARAPCVDLEEEGAQGHHDENAELQAFLRQSRDEYEFVQRAGPRYERGGGSGSGSRAGGSGGPLPSMLRRSQSQIPERVRDYNLGLSSAPRQQRIDTGPWTVKGRTSRELLGRSGVVLFTGEENFTHATRYRSWSTLCHNDRQDPHVDVVDRPPLHIMMIAPALSPVVGPTTRTVLLPLKGASCGHHRGT